MSFSESCGRFLLYRTIHTVDLKNILCHIDSNAIDLHDGLLLTVDWCYTLTVWHIAMPLKVRGSYEGCLPIL